MTKTYYSIAVLLLFVSNNGQADNDFSGLDVGVALGHATADSTGENSYHSGDYDNAFDVYKNIPYSYNTKAKGTVYSAKIGYSWNVSPNLNLGLEFAHHESDADDKASKYLAADTYFVGACEMDSRASHNLKSFDALKLKVSYLPNEKTNLYISAGPAIGRVKSSISHKWNGEIGGCMGPNSGSDTQSEDGFAVSAGAEYLFANNWSANFEYTRLDLSDTKLKLLQLSDGSNQLTYKFENQFDLFQVGIGYHFR